MLSEPGKFTSTTILIVILSLILLCFVIFIILSVTNLRLSIRTSKLAAAEIPKEIKKEKIVEKKTREEEIISNISRCLLSLRKGDVLTTKKIFIRISAIYRKLSEEEKIRVYPLLKKLYEKMKKYKRGI